MNFVNTLMNYLGFLQQFHALSRRDVSRLTASYARVARFVYHRGQPQLEIEAGGYQKVRVANHRDKRRFGPDEMSVLVASNDGPHDNAVTADKSGDKLVVGQCRDDP